MKNKSIKKIIIGGFISIVLLIAVDFSRLFIPAISLQYTLWRQESEYKRLEREEAKTLAKYRDIKPLEFLQYLRNNCQYFSGKDPDSNVNHLFKEVQIENEVPVVYTIDFHNGEKLIKKKTILNRHIDEIERRSYKTKNFLNKETQDYYYYYMYKFLGNDLGIDYGTQINFYVAQDGSYTLGIMLELISCIAHESKDIDKILGDLSKRITATQTQYVGEYEYETMKIIREHGNKEYDSTEIKTAKKISVICTDTGNLYAQYGFDTSNDNYGSSFFIDDNTDNEISYSSGDGHIGSSTSRWYFEDDYIIHHWYSDRGYFEGGDGYTIEYKVYFKKVNGT
jgi:hypothetical protein